jgi:hypothetical protein
VRRRPLRASLAAITTLSVPLAACAPTPDRDAPSAAQLQGSTAPSSTPSVEAPPADEPPDAAPPPTRDTIDCASLVDHQIALHAASEAPLKGPLPPREALLATCASKTLDVEAATCIAAAAEDAALQACSREALGAIVDVKVGRRLDFIAAHGKLDPPLYSLDGDFVVIGEHCGVLYRERYPAGGTFLACDDRLVIGPMVAPMEGLTAYELMSPSFRSPKDVLDALSPSWTAKTGLPLRVHLYDDKGAHIGVEMR